MARPVGPRTSVWREGYELPLGGKYGYGKVSLVDDVDYQWAIQLYWVVSVQGYVMCTSRKAGLFGFGLAHLILGIDPGRYTQPDHISGDKLDNRRQNLRVVSQADNLRYARIRKLHRTTQGS